MIEEPEILELHFYLTDGTIDSFYVECPAEARQTFERLGPGKAFGEPNIVLAGFQTVTALRSDNVEMIDMVTDRSPEWAIMPDGTHAHEITLDEFLEPFSDPNKHETLSRLAPRSVGEDFVGKVQIHFRSGMKIHTEIHSTVKLPMEQVASTSKMMQSVNFYIDKRENGVLIINPKTVIRYEICPGPKHVPKTSIHARHLV